MKYVMGGACVFFLLFAAVRAVRVPFTYDEAASYIRYIDTSVPSVFDTNLLSIFNFEVATNHFLNTALTKLSYVVAGGSEFALRLPNLLGYALYLGFGALILRRLSTPAIALGGLLLLNLNPYVLDFFALSRGYGLSLGLLIASLFFLLQLIEQWKAGQLDRRDLSWGLAAACAAVMANFALLNVYVSMLCVLVIAGAFFRSRAATAPDSHRDRDAARRTRAFPWLPLTAMVFIPLVFSQDIALSRSLYEPVVVRLIGLDGDALDRARVVRIDIHGRESLIGRNAGSSGWSSNGRSHFRGLRIEVPLPEAERLTRIEAIIGARAFSFDPRLTDAWRVRDVGQTRLFECSDSLSLRRSRVATFRSVINWAGDRTYAVQLIIASAVALGILAMCAVLMRLVGRIVVRAKMIRRGEWRAISSSVLWVAALAGTPLYLLKRNSELYFGGTRGVVDDTFTSAIENSFYGRIYSPAQTVMVFALIVGTVAIFFLLLALAYRRGRVSALVPAGSLLAILTMTSLSLAAQRLVFGTVYLVGRTALFYIPLFVLLFTFTCDILARSGRVGRIVSTSIVLAAVSLGLVHFSQTANVRYVYDWKDDASTKSMLEDLRQFATGGPITLGVAPGLVPVAVYYARRSAVPIEVVAAPANRVVDFMYLQDRDVHSGDVVSRYSLTHTALVRVPH